MQSNEIAIAFYIDATKICILFANVFNNDWTADKCTTSVIKYFEEGVV